MTQSADGLVNVSSTPQEVETEKNQNPYQMIKIELPALPFERTDDTGFTLKGDDQTPYIFPSLPSL